ncbi:cytochrome b/b6 domain-containing protein [Afifella sp. IM 167]|uniref:cytochrome b/b6 domain-containing protein n=1 Tax=Afifella sp. IM 167 TaxID=2033586 RepID=UPI001CC92C93|nr:cytochrome b/b6 domain-containing protein [Afifella sp. IM 167]
MLQRNPETVMLTARVKVWDVFVRLFHWSLVAAITVAALTGFLADAAWIRWHIAAGLAAAGLVLARIVWGFGGPTYARFADFVPRPAALFEHLSEGPRHRGHNPLGGAMVLAFMAAILVLAVTGLALLGGVLKTGPLASLVSFDTGHGFGEVHELLAFALLAMVALHVAGVLLESRRSRENLAASMLTGEKEARPGDHPSRPVAANAMAAAAVMALLAAILLAANASLASRPIPRMPVATLDPVYAEECGACHMAYHPSLLPAASWQALMAGLEDHFGENASLDEETAAEIESWLLANAAGTADTKPAHVLARTAEANPFTLTETPFWKHVHGDLPEALFASKPVGSASNCAACHRDAASGLFSPFAIDVPSPTRINKETQQ